MKCAEKTETILTFFTRRLTGLLSSHHDSVAAGFEPVLMHSASYDLSAERYLSLPMICTAAGFTDTTGYNWYNILIRCKKALIRIVFMNVYVRTIYVQDDDFIAGRRQIRIACHADQPRVHVLSSNVRVRQMVDSLAVRPVLKRFIDHRIVQVPGDVRTWHTCNCCERAS